MQSRHALKEVTLVAGAPCACAALFWWLGATFGVLLAGLALSLALARHWKRRQPLRWRGSEIKFENRPLAYHLCTLGLALFTALFILAGMVGILSGTA